MINNTHRCDSLQSKILYYVFTYNFNSTRYFLLNRRMSDIWEISPSTRSPALRHFISRALKRAIYRALHPPALTSTVPRSRNLPAHRRTISWSVRPLVFPSLKWLFSTFIFLHQVLVILRFML